MADTYSSFKADVVKRVDEIFRNHSVKQVYHPVWHTALAFFEGEQWKTWSKIDKQLRDFKPASLTRRMVVNKIEKIVTTFVAHFLRELPTFAVNPNSNTPDDVNAADLGEEILKGEYSPKLEGILSEYFYWKYITGTGIRGLFYDADAPAEVKLPKFDEYGQEAGEELATVPGAGQLYLKAISPFNFFPVGSATVEGCSEILYVEPMPIEVVKQKFGFDAKEETLEIHMTTGVYPRDYREWHQEKFEKRAKVMQYWRPRSDGFKDGLYAVIVNGKVVEYRENPYVKYGYNFPFTKSCAIPVPGQFWGKSPVEQLRRIQISYNYVYSVLLQILERMAKLKWWMPKQSQVDPTAMDSSIGEVVFYTAQPGQNGPTAANQPPIPPYYFQVLEWLDKAFEDVSGFHEVKSARLPTGANNPSGVMVNLLLEQDESRLSPAIKEYLYSLKREAKLYLKMCQDLYEEERFVKIASVEKEAEIIDFRGASILDNTDVVVEIAPVLSESRAVWEQTVWKALEAGVIDPRTAVQKLKLEHPKTLVSVLADERLALRENVEMRMGKPRNVEEWENDEVHLLAHEQFLKTATYERLSDQVKQIFLQHRQMHQQRQAEKFQQRIAAQQQAQGGRQQPTPQGQPQPQGQAMPPMGR